jgi:hypothetical protein
MTVQKGELRSGEQSGAIIPFTDILLSCHEDILTLEDRQYYLTLPLNK